MKKVGIIVEYNPPHNGHLYHLNEVKNKSNANILIAVMSSSIVNRGEIAVFTKFDRASIALEMGVDIVVELPSIYAMQSADIFAKRAVEVLNYLNVDEIWIGSENDNPNIYNDYYNALNNPLYNIYLKEELNNGLSYKTSSLNAFKRLRLDSLLSNDTLGLAYYKAIKDNNYNIELHTIKRLGNNYLDIDNIESLSSASSIRNNQNNIINQVPKVTYDLYLEKGFIDNNKIFNYLKLNILNNDIENNFLVNEGFHNSLSKIYKYNDLDSFISYLTTKRYTITRIKRILMSVLFNLKSTYIQHINSLSITHARVLGYNTLGKMYISEIKKHKNIYTNIKEGINEILDLEIKISKVLDTIYNLDLLKLEQKGPILKKKL